jgi:hypothetical protein
MNNLFEIFKLGLHLIKKRPINNPILPICAINNSFMFLGICKQLNWLLNPSIIGVQLVSIEKGNMFEVIENKLVGILVIEELIGCLTFLPCI